jgi:hypothetical protein
VPDDDYVVDETHRLLTLVVAANARARVTGTRSIGG